MSWQELKEGDVLLGVDPNTVRCSECKVIGKLSRSGYTTNTDNNGHHLTFVFICVDCDYPEREIPNEIKERSDRILDAEFVE